VDPTDPSPGPVAVDHDQSGSSMFREIVSWRRCS
jgi:hypothetical protein